MVVLITKEARPSQPNCSSKFSVFPFFDFKWIPLFLFFFPFFKNNGSWIVIHRIEYKKVCSNFGTTPFHTVVGCGNIEKTKKVCSDFGTI